MASGNKIRWTYVADSGTSYAIAATKAITDQLGVSTNPKVGGSAAALTVPRLPKQIKPRRVKLYNAANGVSRSVICYQPDAELLDGTETTLTLEHAGADIVFTRVGGDDAIIGQRGRDTVKGST